MYRRILATWTLPCTAREADQRADQACRFATATLCPRRRRKWYRLANLYSRYACLPAEGH